MGSSTRIYKGAAVPPLPRLDLSATEINEGKAIEMVSPSPPSPLVSPTAFSPSSSTSSLSTPSTPHISITSAPSKWRETWLLFRGPTLVLVSEAFGGGMAATTRLLEMPNEDGTQGMHTLQILFARFSITLVLSSLYMWWRGIEDFPLGKKEVRPMLVARGCCGFIAVFGFYYSLQYLPMAEAIIIIFITPLMTAYFSSVFLKEPFSRKQLYAGLVSFVGIIIVTDPLSFGTLPPTSAPDGGQGGHGKSVTGLDVTSFQRFSAIGLAIVSDFAAAGAFTFIRVVGTRVHTLISVNYYAMLTTIMSFLLLVLPIFPDVGFRLPHGIREWLLLVGIGVFGFLLQFLMTAALVMDKSARATNMMYSQIVFALLLDWVIWGTVPGTLSWIGGAVVVAGVVWGAMIKEELKPVDEEYGAVPQDDNEEEGANDQVSGGPHLRGEDHSEEDVDDLPKQ